MFKEVLKRYYYLIPAIIFAVLYFQTIFYGSAWGDDPMVISAPAKDFKLMLRTFYDSSVYSGGVHYYPLLYLQCFLINKIFGESAYPMWFHAYHYVSVILICTLACILFYKITKSKLISVLIMLIWAIHPVNVQNFTRLLMSSGYMIIALSFGFLVLYINLSEITSSKIKKFVLFFANFLFFLTLLQAESSILFLPLLFLIFFIREGRDTFSKRNLHLIYPIIVVFLYLLLRFSASGGLFNTSVDTELMKWTEFGTLKDVLFRAFWLAPQLLVHYFKLIFYPFGLIDSKAEWYKVGSSLFSAYSVFCQFVIVSLILLAIYLYKKLPLFSLGISWFFISILLFIQIFPLFTIAGIRYICVPMLGILLAIFSLFLNNKKNIFSKKVLITLFIPVSLFLCFRTIYYLPSSKDFLHQYIYCAKEAPLWNRPHYFAKAIDLSRDEKREAELPKWLTEKAFEEAVYDWLDKYLIIKRDLSIEYGPMQMAYNFYSFRDMFKFLHIDGQLDKLKYVMNSALQVKDGWLGWYEIARFLKQTNQWQPAWEALKNAINSNPVIKHSYGTEFIEIAFKAGAIHEANEILDKYILLSPDSSHPYFVKGLFLNELGYIDEAKECFLQASDFNKSLSVGYDGMYYFASSFFVKYGMYEDAKRVLRLALKFDPFNEKIKNKLKEIEQLV